MLKTLRRIFSRRSPPATAPVALRCLKDDFMVPYCQWRGPGHICTDEHRRYMCCMIWEKGENS